MTDHIAAVRAQARAAAEEMTMYSPEREYDYLFTAGVDWVLCRLTREKIAEAMHRQFLVAEIYLSEFERLTAADAILALLAYDTQS